MCHDQRIVPDASFAAITALPSLYVSDVWKVISPSLYDAVLTKSPTDGVTSVPKDSQRTSAEATSPTLSVLFPFTAANLYVPASDTIWQFADSNAEGSTTGTSGCTVSISIEDIEIIAERLIVQVLLVEMVATAFWSSVIVTVNPSANVTGGTIMINSVAVSSLSCTPAPQSRIIDLEAPEDIAIDGTVPSGYTVTEALPDSSSSALPLSSIVLILATPLNMN